MNSHLTGPHPAHPLRARSALAKDPAATLALTGERTVPGIPEENYWFRRHEVVYERFSSLCAGRRVLEAGSGEGYGADMLAHVAQHVIGLDYDESAIAHVKACYPRVDMRAGNLAELPLADESVDVVVNLQVIEHLWDQGQFIGECARVLTPGGTLLISTPNRITFSPGRDTPLNPFHTRELNGAELTELVEQKGFRIDGLYGVFHGPRLRELDTKHSGSIITAQIERAAANAPWPPDLLADITGITTADFDIIDATKRDIDESLDLVAIAVIDR